VLKVGALPLQLHLQSILLWLILEIGFCELFVWAGLKLAVFLLSVSQVARISGMSHWYLPYFIF
jgi:hypothetical protein